MYGLLLESVRFHMKQKYGQEAWEKICRQCGLKNASFTTANSYSDTIMPKLSEACAKVLPCGRQSDSYMEYFGNCFVNFTNTLGYSTVLKVYSRSFRDFLDNIDSLHEHLRFEFPRLQSPSFECTDESTSGLTLHYRSRRYGYKDYVIGQVKEIAKMYFNIEIEVIVLDEADIVTSFGVRRCHITYRVIFDNSSFKPLVTQHRYLNSLSVPVDLVFNISPFSFLINKDLEIFRASNDLNQYFGENMAGKKILRVFTVRRPPIELTWESLINHGRVIFELVARQASNISLFTGAVKRDSNELSARQLELIERLQKMDKVAPNNLKPKQNSRSATFSSSNLGGSTPALSKSNNQKSNVDKKRNFSVHSNLEKPSRGIIMIRRRSCSFQIREMLAKEQNGALTQDSNDNNDAVTQGNITAVDLSGGSNHGDTICPVAQLKRENTCPKPIRWQDPCSSESSSKEHGLAYKGIYRPEPIGKQYDSSPSHSRKRMHHSTSCPNIDVQETGGWNALSGLHRPEPIGQEDVAEIPDIRATVIVPSSSCATSETSIEQKSKKQGKNGKVQVLNGSEKGYKQQKNAWFKSSHGSFRSRFFRRKITDVPGEERKESNGIKGAFQTPVNCIREVRPKRRQTGAISESNELQESFDAAQAESLCSTGLFRAFRLSITRMRQACFPALRSRNSKVGSFQTPSHENVATTASASIQAEGDATNTAPISYSEPLTRKPILKQSVSANTTENHPPDSRVWRNSDPYPRRNTYGARGKSIDDGRDEEKRKRVEMWLQRQQCRPLHLRGQTKHITSWNMVLFIGTPIIGTVQDLQSSGLYLSDLSMHDGSRFLTMQGTQRLSEIEFACDREKLKRDLLSDTTMKLEEEKGRTEEILYSMMPREIAERMKNGDRELTTCETFDDVTILFGYVTDFTEICNKVEAMKVVKLVSEVFSLFDILSENHKVYKFETIGGGVYMLVSGVPVKIDEHAREMALMALTMLEKIQTIVNPFTNRPLGLQIGIHSGPVVAGVIGQASLQYCLFGNTVNIASRMQTTGEKMKIHLSEATNRELVDSGFITEFRGSVPVKGVGNLDTYWLLGQVDKNRLETDDKIKNDAEPRSSSNCIKVNMKERPTSGLLLT